MNKIIYTLILGICFTACTNEEPTKQKTLFGLPGDTSVTVIAEIKENGQSRAEGEEKTYAGGEIHVGYTSVSGSLKIGESEEKTFENIAFDAINSNLNLTVSDVTNENEWAILRVATTQDILLGWSKPTLNNGNPVLLFDLTHACAKLTLKFSEDDLTNVTANVMAYPTEPSVDLTGQEPTITLTKSSPAELTQFNLSRPVNTTGEEITNAVELTALIPATVENLTDDEVLVINKDNKQYLLKLNDINVEGEKITGLACGQHLTLTVTLNNDFSLISASATLGNWSTSTVNGGTLGGDESKVPDTQNP